MKVISLILFAMLLVGCSSEEDARKHKDGGSMAMGDGLQWQGTVYAKGKQVLHDLGMFDSWELCMQAAMVYMQANKRQDPVYSCGVDKV